jgi:hypothetical protein
MDEAISKVLPARREMQTNITKTRIKNCAATALWEMNLIARPTYPVGECDDWSAIKGYLEHFKLMEKVKGGYAILGNADGEIVEYPTQGAIRIALTENQDFMDVVRTAIIQKVIDEAA